MKGLLQFVLSFVLLSMVSIAAAGGRHHTATTTAGTERFVGGVVDGASILTRTKKGVGYVWSTRGLARNSTYTNWIVTFNNPRKCTTPCACSDVDFMNPAVEIGVFWSTGRFSDRHGHAVFAANVDYGELPTGFDQVPFDENAHPIKKGAEIHLIARGHGRKYRDGEAQLTEFNGGCHKRICEDVLFSVHLSPACKAHHDGHHHDNDD